MADGTYWENPLTGKVEDPPSPWQSPEEWARLRPAHLADTVTRALEHLNQLHESRALIEAKGKAQGVVFQSKLDRTAEMISECEDYIDSLLAQARDIPGFDGYLASSPERRQRLQAFGVRAYSQAAEAETN